MRMVEEELLLLIGGEVLNASLKYNSVQFNLITFISDINQLKIYTCDTDNRSQELPQS